MKAVFDTNTVVSALIFRGASAQVAEAWKSPQVQAFATPAVVAEYLRVVRYPKFGLSQAQSDGLLAESLLPFLRPATAFPGALPYPCKDQDDDIFLRAALGAKADWLVTGDAALLALNGRYRFRIGTPGSFLRALKSA